MLSLPLIGLLMALSAAQGDGCKGGAVPGSQEECPFVLPLPQCDDDCRSANRDARRDHQAWKENDLGLKAMRKNQFAKARDHFRKALQAVPNYPYALTNLSVVDHNEFIFFFNPAVQAYNKGDLKRARDLFLEAQRVRPGDPETRRLLADTEDLLRYRPERAGMVYGTGAQAGWKVPDSFTEAQREDAWAWVNEQARVANRPFPPGVDLKRYSFGIGIAESTTEWYDLIDRVLIDQATRLPVQQTGTSGYNAIKGRRFEQLDCHSNGAMVCLLALYTGDARAQDVVLYGPQLTTNSSLLWVRLLSQRRIRSLRIIVNENDPITPLSLLVSTSPSSWMRARAMLFDRHEVRDTISGLIPGAIVTDRPCPSDWPTLACHRMNAYQTCKPRSALPVAGTGRGGRPAYREPPAPGC